MRTGPQLFLHKRYTILTSLGLYSAVQAVELLLPLERGLSAFNFLDHNFHGQRPANSGWRSSWKNLPHYGLFAGQNNRRAG